MHPEAVLLERVKPAIEGMSLCIVSKAYWQMDC